MTRSITSSIRSLGSVVVILLLFISACTVPEDDSPTILSSDILPQVATPTPVTQNTVTVTIYLYREETGRLFPVAREVESEVRISTLLGELTEDVTEEEREAQLTSPMPNTTTLAGAPAVNTVDDGLAIVTISPTGLPEFQGDVLLQALAQLVYTLTDEATGITQIQLNVEGDPSRSWPRSEGDDEAQTLVRTDFAQFDPDFVDPEPSPEPTADPIEEGDEPADG